MSRADECSHGSCRTRVGFGQVYCAIHGTDSTGASSGHRPRNALPVPAVLPLGGSNVVGAYIGRVATPIYSATQDEPIAIIDERPGVPLVMRFAPNDPATAQYRLPPLAPPARRDTGTTIDTSPWMSGPDRFLMWMTGGFIVGGFLAFVIPIFMGIR